GPAQVARDAAGAVGDPAGHELPRLAVAVRPVLQRLQLGARALRRWPGPVDRRCLLGALLSDPRQRLDRRAVLHDHVPRRAQVGAGPALRGGSHRRRQLVAAYVVHHAADDAQHHRHHGAVLADRHVRQLRHRADPDERRPHRPHPRVRHLVVPGGHPGQRHSARRERLPVHGADSGRGRHLHPARHHPAGERGVMAETAMTAPAQSARRPKYGSMSRDRTWALRWSYFFLILFVIFFLLPPIYMLITSLKTSAEISAARNPWWVFNPTLEN